MYKKRKLQWSFYVALKTVFIDVADQGFTQALWLRSIFELKIEFVLQCIDICSWGSNEVLWVFLLGFSDGDSWPSDYLATLVSKMSEMTDSRSNAPSLFVVCSCMKKIQFKKVI